MNFLQRANLEGLIAWREKYTRGWSEPDPLTWGERSVATRRFHKKLEAAREWLATQRVRRIRPVRGIWTARTAKHR